MADFAEISHQNLLPRCVVCWTSEADEVAEILANFGLEPNEYWPVVEALRKRPEAWINFMMR